MVTENKEAKVKMFTIKKDSRKGFLCKETNGDISILLYEEGDTYTSKSEVISFLRSKYGEIENEGAISEIDRCKFARVHFLASEEGGPSSCVLYKDSQGCLGILRYELQRFQDEESAKDFLTKTHHPSQLDFEKEWQELKTASSKDF
jgi:hypothetical protein